MNDIRIKNFLSPYVRFVNACPAVKEADFYYGNTLVAHELGFGCFTRYEKVSAGVQEFRITKAGKKDEVIASIKVPFGQGEVYTIALVHSDGGSMAYAIIEPTERSDTQYGHLRVCHLSPNLSQLDISLNGHDILGAIDYLEISRYICVSPGKYEIRINTSADGVLKLVMPNQFIKEGNYNTLYITGLSNDTPCLMGILTVDAASYTGYYL